MKKLIKNISTAFTVLSVGTFLSAGSLIAGDNIAQRYPTVALAILGIFLVAALLVFVGSAGVALVIITNNLGDGFNDDEEFNWGSNGYTKEN